MVATSERVLAGVTWLFAGNVLTRILSLAGQIGLGWFLLPEDFGTYAFAISLTTVVAVLRNGGIVQVSIRDGDFFQTKVPTYFKYSLRFNLLAAAILLGLAFFHMKSDRQIAWVLAGIAVSIPLGTSATLFKAQLTIDKRFSDLSRIAVFSALTWQAVTVGAAWAGAGAMSFAAAAIAQALYEYAVSRSWARRHLHASSHLSQSRFLQLLRDTRWLMLGAAATAVASTGGYFVLGTLLDKTELGIYFFAFQLVVAVGSPLYTAVDGVLPTALMRLDSERPRQVQAYLRVVHAVLVTALPLSGALVLTLPAIVHVLWQGKWDAAVPPAQMLVFCVPAWLLVSVARALLDARGRWRAHFVVMLLYALGSIASGYAGALTHSLTWTAAIVAAFYAAFALVLVSVVAWQVRALNPLVRSSLAPILMNAVVLLGCVEAPRTLFDVSPGQTSQLIALTFFVVSAFVVNGLLFRSTWLSLGTSFLTRLRHRAA